MTTLTRGGEIDHFGIQPHGGPFSASGAQPDAIVLQDLALGYGGAYATVRRPVDGQYGRATGQLPALPPTRRNRPRAAC